MDWIQMILPQDFQVGMPVLVKSIGQSGFLAAVSDPSSKGLQVHAAQWNNHFWHVHFPETGELRTFHIDQIEPITL